MLGGILAAPECFSLLITLQCAFFEIFHWKTVGHAGCLRATYYVHACESPQWKRAQKFSAHKDVNLVCMLLVSSSNRCSKTDV